jgi:replicative DNA helicase
MSRGVYIDDVPPYSSKLEETILFQIISQGNNALQDVKPIFGTEINHFFVALHKKVYDVLVEMDNKGKHIDLINVIDYIRYSNWSFTEVEITSIPCFNASWDNKATIALNALSLVEQSMRRQLQKLGKECQVMSTREDIYLALDKAQTNLNCIVEKNIPRNSSSAEDIVKKVVEDIKMKKELGGIRGVPTGLTALDKMTGGLQKSDLIVVAARASMGKSSLATTIQLNAAVQGYPSLLYNLEMSKESCIRRMISMVARIDAQNLTLGNVSDDDIKKIEVGGETISGLPLYIDDSYSTSINDIRTRVRRFVKDYGIKLMVVDYLQLLSNPTSRSREQEVAEMSRCLKRIAKEFEIPIIMLSQLNRDLEKRQQKRPVLADLRESGSIEQDADVVVFIYRPEYYKIDLWEDGSDTKNTAELIIAKQRNGPCGSFKCTFIPEYTLFADYEDGKDIIKGINYADIEYPPDWDDEDDEAF